MSEYIVGGPFEHDDVFVANMGAERTHLYGYELREPIVRCRDCAFMGHDKDGAYCTHFECWLCGEPSFTDVEPDGYCAWGKRRDA